MKARLLAAIIIITSVISTCSHPVYAASEAEKPVVLRICNWEEYIDQGDWGEDEVIDLDSGDIFGAESMIDDFEQWYYDTYGQRVKVEYSTFGTNEDLYNMLTIGDVYDLVCPSEYMIMKLMTDDMVQPLSEEFFDPDIETNYYIKGVSPYISNIFETHDIDGVTWDRCAAGYMWGITGFVYNPDVVSEEEASTWKLLENPAYRRKVTIKDNVRDAYFAAVGALKSDLLTSDEFRSRSDYAMALQTEMNDVSQETVDDVQHYLQQVKDNLYSFETDSGKADMITGKVVANYQWSGDAVYAMDQAEEDDYFLNFAAPKESTNIYFDGWVMLKKGISQDPAKQQAAEAFINFISRPDNAIRNMYYIGYTSVISGGDDKRIFEYLEWNYGTDDEDEATEYPVGYFFSDNADDEDYVLTVPREQLKRQLAAQYPPSDVIDRASIMVYFDQAKSEVINRMWIRVRCFNILTVPVWVWAAILLAICAVAAVFLRQKAAMEKLYN